MTECTPSHCHHHSLSAHLLLKGWNVSGASSWWGITLQRGATPLWYKPPFNTCTPHSKKTKKKQGYVRSVPVFLGSSGDTYHRGGNGLTSKSTIHVITNLSKHQKSSRGFWCIDTPTKLTSLWIMQQRTKKTAQKQHDRLSLEALGPLCGCTSSLYRLWRNLTCQHYMHPRDFAFVFDCI